MIVWPAQGARKCHPVPPPRSVRTAQPDCYSHRRSVRGSSPGSSHGRCGSTTEACRCQVGAAPARKRRLAPRDTVRHQAWLRATHEPRMRPRRLRQDHSNRGSTVRTQDRPCLVQARRSRPRSRRLRRLTRCRLPTKIPRLRRGTPRETALRASSADFSGTAWRLVRLAVRRPDLGNNAGRPGRLPRSRRLRRTQCPPGRHNHERPGCAPLSRSLAIRSSLPHQQDTTRQSSRHHQC